MNSKSLSHNNAPRKMQAYQFWLSDFPMTSTSWYLLLASLNRSTAVLAAMHGGTGTVGDADSDAVKNFKFNDSI